MDNQATTNFYKRRFAKIMPLENLYTSKKECSQDALLPAMFNLLQSSYCLKSTSATDKITDNFHMNGSLRTTKLTLFALSKDEWDKKEDTGKSMKKSQYAQQYGKSQLSSWSDVKQWSHSLSQKALVGQSVGRSVSQSVS